LFVMSKCCTFRQKKFLVCVNIPGNKTVSDSDSDENTPALHFIFKNDHFHCVSMNLLGALCGVNVVKVDFLNNLMYCLVVLMYNASYIRC